MNVVAAFTHNRLDVIKRRIAAGHERASKGGVDWIEGTLEIAAAMHDAHANITSSVTFNGWLSENKVAFYNKNDRLALLHFATNLELSRKVLTETKSRCYDLIWRENRHLFSGNKKTNNRYSKPRARYSKNAMIFRRMKLGDELVDALKGTTLDSAPELDELIILNRGAPHGELTEAVQHLTAEAIAGKQVSALGYTADLGTLTRRKHLPTLNEAWRKHMAFAWDRADKKQREMFVLHLMDLTKEEDAS